MQGWGKAMTTNFTDWLAICETKARYCLCLDTKDWAGYADCFTEDLVMDNPPERIGNSIHPLQRSSARVTGLMASPNLPSTGLALRAQPPEPACQL
jgi:SnoaL-like domain